MALRAYQQKRKFSVTPEPRGRVERGRGNTFVIQKHDARRMHYDLRLQFDGVMKSWAVTRGPSLVPTEKRLAVHVEDHPLEYNTFEGTIPKGEYGGGTVLIWDRGKWNPVGDPAKGYAKGHLEFELAGRKLHGRWHLVRMRGRPREKTENWLLIKAKDDASRGPRDPDILEEMPLSVATGRSIPEIAAGKSRVWHTDRGKSTSPATKARGTKTAAATPNAKAGSKTRAEAIRAERLAAPAGTKAKPAALPDFVPPSLATLRDYAPAGADWLHEIKFDGYRMQARLDRGRVRLRTRKGLDWTERFQPIAQALSVLPAERALIDGEIVVEDEHGRSNFSALQDSLKSGQRERFVYYVFDLLHLNGRDLTRSPLLERKIALQRLLKSAGNASGKIRFSEHFHGDGPSILKAACGMQLEGIISKRRDAPYRSGRTENLIKTKCAKRQEFVVAGYTPSTAMRRAVGALTVGYHENGELRYGGRVGTGYTAAMAHELWDRLEELKVDRPPVRVPPSERRKNVHWVKPEIVIEAGFRGWTSDGLLRQASFKGVREDKPAREIVREEPAMAANQSGADNAGTRAETSSRQNARNKPAGKNRETQIGQVRLTHPDRIYWPDAGVTKQQLAEYYDMVWEHIAPHIVGRPLALLRCPDGIAGQCFFQKHIPATIKESSLRRMVKAKEKDVIVADGLDELLTLVQSGALELHVRGSRLEQLEICDRIVFDLDPGEGVTWQQMVAAGRDVRERLASLKLESFVKLSGGKGLHVMLPIKGSDWDTAKDFAQAVAFAMAADDPKRYVAKMTKNLRRNRIFIDYFRNSREATSVAAYSTRARKGAPVSAPVTWEELGRTRGADHYTLPDLRKRLGRLRKDPWADVNRVKQGLPRFARGRSR